MTPPEQAEYDREVTALHAQMEAETVAAQWATGRTMTMEQAIAYALATGEAPEPAPTLVEPNPVLPPPPTYPAGLSTREVEVLQLLAQGLTYVQIADKLVVSRRTVNAHVGSIYSKLAVHSRAAATRFAIDHHLV
jgi:DNA-binding NarL/FixJ family response regulator